MNHEHGQEDFIQIEVGQRAWGERHVCSPCQGCCGPVVPGTWISAEYRVSLLESIRDVQQLTDVCAGP